MVIAYIGLGSNLGDREANLRTALAYLRETGTVEVLELSRFTESEPFGGPSQPDYLNAVARVRTELPPLELLAVLKEAEKAAGRHATGVRWGPREADLDLLLYGDVVMDAPTLTVPHPRMKERDFVLVPLAEIAADVRDPVSGKTVRELLGNLRRRRTGRRTVRLITTIAGLDEYVAMVKRNRFTLCLVPTMGAFHEGHLSLMRAARAECDKVLVSLFVNPTQFGEGEDLDSYPRRLERDLALAADAGADVVFAPSAEEMYPDAGRTWVTVEGLSDILCGAVRPGHFRGVATVVSKLFHLVRPDMAWFGQKDYQQSVIIRRMVRDLNVPVEIRVLPTVREPDGLAMSSRNRYLDAEERKRASCLHRGLMAAREAHAAGERSAEALAARVREVLEATECVEPDYVAVVHPETLAPVADVTGGAVILVAARVGPARLIDNLILE